MSLHLWSKFAEDFTKLLKKDMPSIGGLAIGMLTKFCRPLKYARDTNCISLLRLRTNTI